MKTKLFAVLLLLTGSIPGAVFADEYCNLMRYWPMHDGDSLNFSSSVLGPLNINYRQGWSSSEVIVDFGGYETDYYEYSDGQLLMQSGDALGDSLEFDPYLVLLTESLAANGGTVSSSAESELYGYTLYLTLKATVSQAGTITVPAGTFSNCRKLDLTLKLVIPGALNKTFPFQTLYLAPGVGPIKVAGYQYDDNLNAKLLGWAELDSGTVGGVDVTMLAPLSTNLPPKITAQPKSLTATNYGTATMSVAVSGTAPFTYQWFNGNDALTNDSRISGVDTTKLTIQNVQFSDAGSYHVEIANVVCSVQSTSAVLNVVADIAKPTLAITSPKSGQRCSNCVFTVIGTTKDNARVSSVFCSLNGASWICADGTTNWAATHELKPGTNVLRAYASDAAGNLSSTSSVSFVYVVCVPLCVKTTGLGTVTPNYDGKVLEIGKNYVMTAKAGKGYAFYYWGGCALTNSATLKFFMASNLTFIANFKDVTRPVCIITFPKVNQKWSNAVINVTGKASDNAGVSNVWYQLNGAGWVEAAIVSGGTNWATTNLTLIPGTNLIQAFAVDGTGNASLTNSVKFNRVIVPDWAPDALVGLMGPVSDSSAFSTVSFGTNTFSLMASNNLDLSGVGSYGYLKVGTNAAELQVLFTDPPTIASNAISAWLTFTGFNRGFFTNLDNGETGPFSFSIAASLAPDSLAGKSVVAKTDIGTLTLKFSTSTTYSASDGSYGNFDYQKFTPAGGMMRMHLTNPGDFGEEQYIHVTFTSKTAGNYVASFFQSDGTLKNIAAGTFTMK
jgi:hypothetical protein